MNIEGFTPEFDSSLEDFFQEVFQLSVEQIERQHKFVKVKGSELAGILEAVANFSDAVVLDPVQLRDSDLYLIQTPGPNKVIISLEVTLQH